MYLALVLNRYFPHGGLQIQAGRLAQALVARGHQVTVLTRRWDGDPWPQVTVRQFPVTAWAKYALDDALAAAIQPTLRAFDGVIGFMPMAGLDVFYAADVCFQQQAQERYGPWYRWTPRYRCRVAREAAVFARGNAAILTLHPGAAGPFQRGYGTPAHRFHEIPPGIRRFVPISAATRAQYRQAVGVSAGQPLCLAVGSGFHTKGLDRTIRALGILGRRPNRAASLPALLVIGAGKTAFYRQLARFYGVDAHFLGVRDDVSTWMATADVLIHPARRENTGNVILEALVAGLPVVTVDHCGFAPHVTAAQLGAVLASPFRVDDLTSALEQLLVDVPSHREHWRQQGMAYGERHDFYRRAEHAADLIVTILATRGG